MSSKSIIDTGAHCTLDGKIIFSKHEAYVSASLIRVRKKLPTDAVIEAYRGDCGFWHIGHNMKRW